MRANSLAAALALALGLHASAAGAAAEAPDALIADAMNAPAQVRYAGTVEFVKIGADGAEASVYRIEHDPPDRTLRRYTAPASLSGDAMLSIGPLSYAIDVKRHRVVRSRNPAIGDQTVLSSNYLLLRANYAAEARGASSVAGRPVASVALVNTHTHATVALVRIDTATGLVLDEQRFGPAGDLISEMRFDRVAYPKHLAASDFALPHGFPIVDGPQLGVPSGAIAALAAHAGFQVADPAALPGGFSAVAGTMLAIKHVRTLQILYSDGLRTISLFENASAPSVDLARYHPKRVALGRRSGEFAQRGATDLLAWQRGSVHYTLVGEVNLAQLRACAGAIAP